MDIYDIWIDGDGNHHKICEMTTRYINSCVKQINKCADSWRGDTWDQLSVQEMARVNDPMQRAWFVVHAEKYLEKFLQELTARDEDASEVEYVLDRIQEAREQS